MILIAYDGSPDAKAAIEHAAHLMPGQPVAVVTVWEPYVQMLTRYPLARRHGLERPHAPSPGRTRWPRHCCARPTAR
jgi:Universal stress protein family